MNQIPSNTPTTQSFNNALVMSNNRFKIVLLSPVIPGNTGSIGRTCVALGVDLILVKPYGFDLSERAVRRAGLDYWKYVSLKEYGSWNEFLATEKPARDQLIFFESREDQNFYEANYSQACYLIFGSETKGIAENIREEFLDRFYELPMFSDKIRSLNLSNAATTAAYECLRHISYS